MAAAIAIHTVAFQKSLQGLPHIAALTILFVGVGIERMVTNHDLPASLALRQGLFDPAQLCLFILLSGIGVFVAFLPVFVDQRGGVNEEE